MLTSSTTSTNPIDLTNNATTLSNAINNINRIQQAICLALPSSVYGSLTTLEQCVNVVIINYMYQASLVVGTTIAGGNSANSQEALNNVNNAFAAGKQLDGSQVVRSTSTSTGFSSSNNNTTEDEGGANLGLILGLSIPLVLLRRSCPIQSSS